MIVFIFLATVSSIMSSDNSQSIYEIEQKIK